MGMGRGRDGVLVIAHRGASGSRPEHTAAAVRRGFELGADAVEPDLVPTRDGVLVVRHDLDLRDTTDIAEHPELPGTRTVDLSLAEIARLRARERLPELRPASAAFDGQEPVLAFADYLALIPHDRVLVAELKAAPGFDVADLFLRELGGFPWERLVVECFELEPLRRLAEAGLGAPGRGASLVHLSEEPLDAAALPAAIGGVSYDKALLLAPGGAALVAAAKATGRFVYTWTLRPENAFLDPRWRRGDDPAAWGDWAGEFRAVLDTGVDGVFADHPDLVRSLLDSGQGEPSEAPRRVDG